MMHAEADAGSRKSSSKHIEAECPPKKLCTSKVQVEVNMKLLLFVIHCIYFRLFFFGMFHNFICFNCYLWQSCWCGHFSVLGVYVHDKLCNG